ncbi:unnamed protein product [Ectocarpus sp. 12 AP-2014]
MARKNYLGGAQALLLVVAPLCCHAFVQPAGKMLPKAGTQSSCRHHHHHAHLNPAAAAPAGRPRRESSIRATEASVPEFGGIQHAGVLVSDSMASKEFYVNVFGFEDDSPLRPQLPFDGAFVRAGATQIHLMELPNPDPVDGRPEHGGRDRHVAFSIADLQPLKSRLDSAGVTYTMSKSGRAALFCRDLDGNAFEFIQQAL